MKPKPILLPAVNLMLCVLFFAMTFMVDSRAPQDLEIESGFIVDKEPLREAGLLTGFRIHVGHPPLTLTYRRPDPDMERVWSTIQTSRTAKVRYAVHTDRPPTLWELEADGRPVATLADIQAARSTWFWLHLGAAVLAGGIGLASVASWFRKASRFHRWP